MFDLQRYSKRSLYYMKLLSHAIRCLMKIEANRQSNSKIHTGQTEGRTVCLETK